MSRRVTELANSPTRLNLATQAALGHSRSTSNTSRISPSPQRLKMEDSVSPAPFDAPVPQRSSVTFAPNQQVYGSSNLWVPNGGPSSASMSPMDTDEQFEDSSDQQHFTKFLRQTTCLSNSTNNTTGSFHRVLANYSEPYVQTVKRLVKRFTAPIANRSSLSPYSDGNVTIQTWADEEDCPPEFGERPFPIPGDFLKLDEYHNQKGCYSTQEAHSSQRCLCYMALDTCVLPWVTRERLTPAGQRLLTNGPKQHDVSITDSFGNTVLHFLAARGSIEVLEYALGTDYCRPIAGAKNSAGQTFLHVLNPFTLENPDYVDGLLKIIANKNYDLHARDHYGRSFFHLLQVGEYPDELLQRVATLCNNDFQTARDAFGFTPVYHDSLMDLDQPGSALQQDPGISKESKLLEHVRLANENPHLQDEEGRNGLHCLAIATLSHASVVNKYHLQSTQREKITKKQQTAANALDSSAAKLELRLGLLVGLLDAGVDPNQHDKNGNTPLMTFVAELPEDDDYKIPPKLLKLLIDRGANIHARNRRGETALHIAVRCGRKLAMRTLSQLGANVHGRDSAGRSLLDVADAKMMNCESDEHMRDYAHYEACRAWLSGKGKALQGPSVIDEWGF